MATTKETLERATRDVDELRVDADPRIKKLRGEIAAAERDHVGSTRETARLRSRLAGIDENLVRAHKELSELRDQLPHMYATVLVGRTPPAHERQLLDRIAELEQVIARGRAGRPLVEQMVREALREVAPHARRIEDLQRDEARLRQDVRIELARRALA